jgi:hypothetical protein
MNTNRKITDYSSKALMIDPNYNTILDKGSDSGQTTLSYRKLITLILATLHYCTEMFHFYLNYCFVQTTTQGRIPLYSSARPHFISAC